MIRARQIDERIPVFPFGRLACRTPFARVLRVIDSAPWQQKRLPAPLRHSISARWTSGAAGGLLRPSRSDRQLRPSGSRRATLAKMTRSRLPPVALVCVDADQSA